MLRTSDAIGLGVHPRTLYNLRDRGELEQVGRGIIPRAVICLISALAHHGLTTQVPHAVDVALPSHAQVPKLDGIPLRVFWYSDPSFSAGIDVISIDQVPVRVYSPEKTIADCFKYRNKIGLDVAVEALQTYCERTLPVSLGEVAIRGTVRSEGRPPAYGMEGASRSSNHGHRPGRKDQQRVGAHSVAGRGSLHIRL
jgi:hypothetical protein